ncbi:hypothetical protein [Candidatus Alkanophaga liquidiphilum]
MESSRRRKRRLNSTSKGSKQELVAKGFEKSGGELNLVEIAKKLRLWDC